MNKNKGKKYNKPLSLYPLKPGQALKAFMEVYPDELEKKLKKLKN